MANDGEVVFAQRVVANQIVAYPRHRQKTVALGSGEDGTTRHRLATSGGAVGPAGVAAPPLNQLREDDVLVVWKLDRLPRLLKNLLGLLKKVQSLLAPGSRA